jgi:hypothetical protein
MIRKSGLVVFVIALSLFTLTTELRARVAQQEFIG